MAICRRFPSITLWVDAICIIQLGLDERNSQVQLMSRIYRSADAVMSRLSIQKPWSSPKAKDQVHGLLSLLPFQAATDARDKIYAILSLLPSGSPAGYQVSRLSSVGFSSVYGVCGIPSVEWVSGFTLIRGT